MRLRWPVALVLLAVASSAAAQNLSELAAKEKQRRNAVAAGATPARSFTNDDLEKSGPQASPTPSPTGAGPTLRPGVKPPARPRRPSRDEGAPDSEDEENAEAPPPAEGQPGAEAAWRQRAKSAQDAISAAEQRVAAAERALGAARTGISQPLPSDGLRQTPPNALVKEASLQSAEAALATARASLDQARTAWADLEELARKASIPPGWLR